MHATNSAFPKELAASLFAATPHVFDGVRHEFASSAKPVADLVMCPACLPTTSGDRGSAQSRRKRAGGSPTCAMVFAVATRRPFPRPEGMALPQTDKGVTHPVKDMQGGAIYLQAAACGSERCTCRVSDRWNAKTKTVCLTAPVSPGSVWQRGFPGRTGFNWGCHIVHQKEGGNHE